MFMLLFLNHKLECTMVQYTQINKAGFIKWILQYCLSNVEFLKPFWHWNGNFSYLEKYKMPHSIMMLVKLFVNFEVWVILYEWPIL